MFTLHRSSRSRWTDPRVQLAPVGAIWDLDSGEFQRVEGLRGFESYRKALQASQFLARLESSACPSRAGAREGLPRGVESA